jgi:pilus assembly protein Flp/PilA
MTKLFTAAKNLIREEEGASLAEYGLLLALIAIVCVASIALLGNNISSMFNYAATSV